MTSAAFDAETAAARVAAALLPLADPERAAQAKRYLKSDRGPAPAAPAQAARLHTVYSKPAKP